MMVSGTFSELLAPGLQKVFNRAYNEAPEMWTQFFNAESSDRAYEEHFSWAGFEPFQPYDELEDIQLRKAKPGYKVRYGTSPTSLTRILDIGSPAITTAVIEGLASGTWYFTVASYTNVGIESAQTRAVSKTVPWDQLAAPHGGRRAGRGPGSVRRLATGLNPFHEFPAYLLVSSTFAQGVRWLRTSRNC